jgi:myo-inositol-1(or 4)-monophosphatase
MEWEQESELALRAVSTACMLFEDRPSRAVIGTKEFPRDVVTEQDLRVEEHLKSALRGSRHPIVAEETAAATPVPVDCPAWVLDPIDGTANYARQLHYYGVSLGLIVMGRDGTLHALTGAVALPQMRELFFVWGDRTSFLNGNKLTVSDGGLDSSLVGACFSSGERQTSTRDRQNRIFGAINDRSAGALRLGSASAQICYTAAGRLQATYGLGVRLWDVGASLAIARCAGCHLYVTYRAEDRRVDFVVGAPTPAAEVAAIIRKEGITL